MADKKERRKRPPGLKQDAVRLSEKSGEAVQSLNSVLFAGGKIY